MIRYVLKRLAQSCLTILIIVTVVFLLLRMMPSDYYFSEEELAKLTDAQKHDILLAQGLLDPPLEQLSDFYKNLLRLDFGISRRIQSGVPVIELISSKFAVSMRLGLTSLAISFVLGITMGVFQALNKDGWFDSLGVGYTIFANAVPALVSFSLILVFGAKVLKLPSMYSTRKVFISSIMPVICLSVSSIAGYALWIRRYMVDEITKDYIKLARIKGLSEKSIMIRHVLRNAFVPLAQYLPQSILYTIGGSLLVERFFSVPGMGDLLTESISRYDTGVAQIMVMLYATLGIVGLFLGDVLMSIIDPRIRLTGKGEVR